MRMPMTMATTPSKPSRLIKGPLPSPGGAPAADGGGGGGAEGKAGRVGGGAGGEARLAGHEGFLPPARRGQAPSPPLVHVQSGQHGRKCCDRRWAGVEVRRRGGLQEP